jgi:hypothetical protein
LDAGGLRLAGEVVVELVGDEDEVDGLMGVGAPFGGGYEEGGVLLQPLDIGLGGEAFDFQDVDLLFRGDDSVGAGAAMSDILNRTAESAVERALSRVSGRASLEALKDRLTVDRA